jgi:uncharacterized delta-60 repeat protein
VKGLAYVAAIGLLALVGCNPAQPQPNPAQPALGLLEVTISGLGDGSSPTATAQWITGASAEPGVSGQAATVVPVSGTANLNDVQLITRLVSAEDDELNAKRYVRATFNLVNRSTNSFANFTLHAVHKNGVSIGGTGISSMTSSAGTAITTAAIARGFRPTHGMRPSVGSLKVNEDIADLQLFTPAEVDAPTTGVKQQAMALGLLSATDTVLEYGFVARNFSGGRIILPRNTATDCTSNNCKATLTLAYQLPKVSPRQDNPFSLSLYFLVANEINRMGSQSEEEQTLNTVTGLASSSVASLVQVRTLRGSTYTGANNNNLCSVITAIPTATHPGNVYLPSSVTGVPGSLDVCFGTSGKQTTDFATSSNTFSGLAFQADGKIVAIGRSPAAGLTLARYNPNGSLDTGFGSGGKVITTFSGTYNSVLAQDVAIQSDGKIVVFGEAWNTTVSRTDFAVVRYTTTGTLDTSFDGDGLATVDIFEHDYPTKMALQGDGKIVLVGSSYLSFTDLALARLNPNGSLDTTFDGDGKVRTIPTSQYDSASDMVLQADGKIVVVGVTQTTSGPPLFLMVRYNTNGSLDTTLDGDGIVMDGRGRGHGVALQNDGKFLIASEAEVAGNTDFSLRRYNTNGSLDTTFTEVITPIGAGNEKPQDIALQSNGKIILAGSSYNGTNDDFALVRYNPDGSLDSTFGTGGKVTTAFGSSSDIARTIAIQANGKIVVGGTTLGTTNDFALARYNP